jgi:hypothetical protein
VFQARWVFVYSFLLLRNHFGLDAIRMIAAEAGFYLPDVVVDSLTRHELRAQQQSAYRKDPVVRLDNQRRRKHKKMAESQNQKRDQKSGIKLYTGHTSAAKLASADVDAEKPKRRRITTQSSSASSSSSSSSPAAADAFFL